MFRPIIAVCCILLPSAAALADDLHVLGGKSLNGTTMAIDEKGVVVKVGAETITTPLPLVLGLNLRPEKGIPTGTKFLDVRLIDDTVLHCLSVDFLPRKGKEAQQVELGLLSGIKLTLPLAFVSWIVREAQDSVLRKKWDEEIVFKRLKVDRVVVLSGGDLNPLEGTLGEVKVNDSDPKDQIINFTRSGGGLIPVKVALAHGMVFFRPDPPKDHPICRVFDTQGNALAALKVKLDGTNLEVTTTFGAKLNLEMAALSRIDFNMGKLTFLSDLEPVKVVEKSRLGLTEPYRKDRSLDNQPIVLDKSYAKGLSMHAHTELEYNLEKKFKEFKAMLGIDARAGVKSQALVSIYCDGKMTFSQTAAKAVEVRLDLTNVSNLRIVVSRGDFFGMGDQATLADAQVSK